MSKETRIKIFKRAIYTKGNEELTDAEDSVETEKMINHFFRDVPSSEIVNVFSLKDDIVVVYLCIVAEEEKKERIDKFRKSLKEKQPEVIFQPADI